MHLFPIHIFEIANFEGKFRHRDVSLSSNIVFSEVRLRQLTSVDVNVNSYQGYLVAFPLLSTDFSLPIVNSPPIHLFHVTPKDFE